MFQKLGQRLNNIDRNGAVENLQRKTETETVLISTLREEGLRSLRSLLNGHGYQVGGSLFVATVVKLLLPEPFCVTATLPLTI